MPSWPFNKEFRPVGAIAYSTLFAIVIGQTSIETNCGSYLYQPAYCEDQILRGPARPYQLQPGDIFMSADGSKFWLTMHKLAGTSHPTHSGIVFRRLDGTIAILEAGPHDTLRIRTLDAVPHLQSYETEGRVWIRRRAVPLTKEQSDCLTAFAMAQDGKLFALIRLGGQLTPLRSRGPLRTYVMGKPHGGDRPAYYCSELVTETLVASGLVDGKTARPSATYPRDLFMDHSPNLYINKHFKLAPCWDPPARWVSGIEPCQVDEIRSP
jgi:hypothetical protein